MSQRVSSLEGKIDVLSAMELTSRFTGIARLKSILEDMACCRIKLLFVYKEKEKEKEKKAGKKNDNVSMTNTHLLGTKKKQRHTLIHEHQKSNQRSQFQHDHLSETSFVDTTPILPSTSFE
jgi:hypothetical protein